MATASLPPSSKLVSLSQVSGKSLPDYSGLKNSTCISFQRRNDDFLSHTSLFIASASSSGAKRGVTEAKIKVAINGFGRIGRNFLRCWHGRKDSPLEVVIINDTGGVKQASHLLKYDSMLGTFDADIQIVGDDSISVDGKVIKIVSTRNPLNLPWKAYGINLVIEGTGVFVSPNLGDFSFASI